MIDIDGKDNNFDDCIQFWFIPCSGVRQRSNLCRGNSWARHLFRCGEVKYWFQWWWRWWLCRCWCVLMWFNYGSDGIDFHNCYFNSFSPLINDQIWRNSRHGIPTDLGPRCHTSVQQHDRPSENSLDPFYTCHITDSLKVVVVFKNLLHFRHFCMIQN